MSSLFGLIGPHVLFAPDGSGGGASTDDSAGDNQDQQPQDDQQDQGADNGKQKFEWTPEQQEEINRLLGKTRKDTRERVSKEFEAKGASAKAAADKQKMLDDGKYQDLATAAESARDEALKRADELAAELTRRERLESFYDETEKLKISFPSKQAAADAFSYLDSEIVGEDGAGMKKAIEEVRKARPYLFADADSKLDSRTDAKPKGGNAGGDQSEQRNKEISARYRIPRPR